MATISVSDEVWEFINKQRKAEDTFNDVLERELKIKKVKHKKGKDDKL